MKYHGGRVCVCQHHTNNGQKRLIPLLGGYRCGYALFNTRTVNTQTHPNTRTSLDKSFELVCGMCPDLCQFN